MEKAYEITPGDGKTIFVGVPDNKVSIYSTARFLSKILESFSWGETQNQIRKFQDM